MPSARVGPILRTATRLCVFIACLNSLHGMRNLLNVEQRYTDLKAEYVARVVPTTRRRSQLSRALYLETRA
jgi:hypothetical protein